MQGKVALVLEGDFGDKMRPARLGLSPSTRVRIFVVSSDPLSQGSVSRSLQLKLIFGIFGDVMAILLSLLVTAAVTVQQSDGFEVSSTVDGSAAGPAYDLGNNPTRFVSVNSSSQAIRLPITLVPGSSQMSMGPDQDVSTSVSTLMLPGPRSRNALGHAETTGPAQALVTTAASLGVVLGLFLLLVWFQRRVAGRNGSMLPGEVVQTLGRVPLNGRQEMHLVKVGNKLLLLAVTATSAETLTEITDPIEIDRLSGICRHDQPGSISASFREILSQLQQPSSPALIR